MITAAAAMLALLAAGVPAVGWQDRIPATAADVAPLFDALARFGDRRDLDRGTVERAFGIGLAAVDRSDAFAVFASTVPKRFGGSTLRRVELRLPHPGGPATAGALLVLDLAGPCIGRADVDARFGPLALTQVPRGGSRDEQAVWSRARPDRTLGFGFPERDAACLATVSVRVHAPPARPPAP